MIFLDKKYALQISSMLLSASHVPTLEEYILDMYAHQVGENSYFHKFMLTYFKGLIFEVYDAFDFKGLVQQG